MTIQQFIEKVIAGLLKLWCGISTGHSGILTEAGTHFACDACGKLQRL